jgi:H+/Cl- antiporter ClcA/CBS-domain-containing membrane protein
MIPRLRAAWKRRTETTDEHFMVCPYCSQWGPRGKCMWCGFDADDAVAVAKLLAEKQQAAAQRQAFRERLVQPVITAWERRQHEAQANYMVCPNCHQWGKRGVCQWCGFDALDEKAIGLLRAEEARFRIERRAKWQRTYDTINGLFRVNPGDFLTFLKTGAKWLVLGSGVGVLAGTASAIFLTSLQWATSMRLAHPELLFLLPIAGFLLGWIYFNFAGSAARGNNLVIDEVNTNREPIPLRMAPLVLMGTVITHLFGGSAGREGTAIQMGASLADWLQRKLRLSQEDRRMMLMAGISGGFGSVFGTPIAGFVFGLEVQSIGRIHYEGIIPCLIAAVVGDIVTRAWGVTHSVYPKLAEVSLDNGLLLKVTLASIAFGLASFLFIELTHGIKHLMGHLFGWSPIRPTIGGLVIIGLTLVLGTQDYLGLSLPLIQQSLNGAGVIALAFLLKIIFTSITLGTGFLGGEVTPLFVIGSTLGYTMGRVLGVDPVFMASIGFVSVFAGAANTPLACALMGIELFGGGSALYLVVGCVVAYLSSGLRSIYVTQRIGIPKVAVPYAKQDESVETIAKRRPGWLPSLPALANVASLRPVRAIMSPNPVAVRTDTLIPQLVDIAIREGVRTLPVLDEHGVVIGIVTDNDLLRRGGLAMRLGLMIGLTTEERATLMRSSHNRTAGDIMTAPPVTLLHTATLGDAVDLMTEHDLKRVPVVDQAGHLMGMLTRSDLLRELTFSETAPVWSVEGQEVPLSWKTSVEQIMTSEVTMVKTTTPVPEVIQAMMNTAQKRIIVADEAGQAVGIITDGDLLVRAHIDYRSGILRALPAVWNRNPHTSEWAVNLPSQTAADVMTAPVVMVPVGTSAREALRILMEKRIKRLPVVDEQGVVVGLVGRAGLMRAILAKPTTATPQGVPSVVPSLLT